MRFVERVYAIRLTTLVPITLPLRKIGFQSHCYHGILCIIFRHRLQGANGLSLVVPYTAVLRLTIHICHRGELCLLMKFAPLQTTAEMKLQPSLPPAYQIALS